MIEEVGGSHWDSRSIEPEGIGGMKDRNMGCWEGWKPELELLVDGEPEYGGRMNIRNKIMTKIEKQMRTGYPPGYNYRYEWRVAELLLGSGLVFSLRFFSALYNEWRFLKPFDVDFGQTRKEWSAAEPFMMLMEGRIRMFVPFFLFLGAMAIYHYFYYYQGAKSIYLMRRLPKRGAMIKSCAMGPFLCMGAGAAVILVLYLLYFGIYLLIIPPECLPGWW